ncbi:MAG: outer membrane lipoprotein carrier protein LolA [Alphaproteobacteria bacterium]
MKRLAGFLVFLALLMPLTADAKKGDADWNANIKIAEDYLSTLSTARARFVQTTHDGTQLVGTFYLQRPGKLRFQYDKPIEDFVVADGFFIYFYDSQLKEQTNAPIGQTLADFILRPDLKLRDDLTVKDIKKSGDLMQIEIVQTSDPDAGSLTLGFSEDPIALKKWRVVDGQGLITEVELFYLKTDVKHASDLFVYKNPDGGVTKVNN